MDRSQISGGVFAATFSLQHPDYHWPKRKKQWIQKAKVKKGALSRQLRITEKEDIPMGLLNKIVSAKAGETIRNPTKTGKRRIKVTRLLERIAILARNLKRMRRR